MNFNAVEIFPKASCSRNINTVQICLITEFPAPLITQTDKVLIDPAAETQHTQSLVWRAHIVVVCRQFLSSSRSHHHLKLWGKFRLPCLVDLLVGEQSKSTETFQSGQNANTFPS